jgi:hypothetical protein
MLPAERVALSTVEAGPGADRWRCLTDEKCGNIIGLSSPARSAAGRGCDRSTPATDPAPPFQSPSISAFRNFAAISPSSNRSGFREGRVVPTPGRPRPSRRTRGAGPTRPFHQLRFRANRGPVRRPPPEHFTSEAPCLTERGGIDLDVSRLADRGATVPQP